MADDQTQNVPPSNEEAVVGKAIEKSESGKSEPKKPSLVKLLGTFMRKDKKSENEPKNIAVVKKSTLKFPVALNAQKINLKSVNQILIVILVGLVGWVIYVSVRHGPEISSVISAVSSLTFVEVAPKNTLSFKEINYYLDQIKQRDIFNIFEEEKKPVVVVEKEGPPPPEPPKVTISEKAKNLKLIGISWGANPKAIIRETSSDEMYFIKEGEMIKGTEITVKKIMKEEVIIVSDGDEMSML